MSMWLDSGVRVPGWVQQLCTDCGHSLCRVLCRIHCILYFSRNFAILYCFVWTGWARVAENSKSFQCEPCAPFTVTPLVPPIRARGGDYWPMRAQCCRHQSNLVVTHTSHIVHTRHQERGEISIWSPSLLPFKYTDTHSGVSGNLKDAIINRIRYHIAKSISFAHIC